jgi:hypothetical protein
VLCAVEEAPAGGVVASRGWNDVTLADVERLKAGLPGKAQAKYRNVKKSIDGITFDSTREANVYQGLKARERIGEICDLRCQVPFDLLAPAAGETGQSVVVSQYIADFTHFENGQRVVTDAKGKRTQMYALKRKWLELQTGIRIQEV